MSDDYGCDFLSEGINLNNSTALEGQDFYIPGNGYVYTDFDSSGGSLHRKRQKWAFDGKDVKEVAQPYYYLGIKSTYHGDDNDSTGKLDKKATLALTDASGQKSGDPESRRQNYPGAGGCPLRLPGGRPHR